VSFCPEPAHDSPLSILGKRLDLDHVALSDAPSTHVGFIREHHHAAAEHAAIPIEGVSPFARQSFEPILSAAGVRLDRDGCYAPDAANGTAGAESESARLTVTDKWVLFARPRSQHVILQDIDRLRCSAENEEIGIKGLAKRLVTEPSNETPQGSWEPLSTRIGESGGGSEAPLPDGNAFDVFFPKPFNDDQLEIIRRLSRGDGLVVQGPPGTGKTHTIANLICHAMATGQRVLVVSRGEAALAVLRDQLPAEVRPLAISVLPTNVKGSDRLKARSAKSQAWWRERSHRTGALQSHGLNRSWKDCVSTSRRSIGS
jgi:AAA domain